DYWKTKYDCYDLNPIVYNGKVNYGFIADHTDQFVELWKQLAISNPDVMARHFSCVTAMVWEVSQPPGSYFTADGYPPAGGGGISNNNVGLKSDSLWPWMSHFL